MPEKLRELERIISLREERASAAWKRLNRASLTAFTVTEARLVLGLGLDDFDGDVIQELERLADKAGV